jgi:[ribosomal protein S5]-alanine N-acetyltransferase
MRPCLRTGLRKKIQSLYSQPVYTTEAEVEALLNNYINKYQLNDYYRWAIISKEKNECIGQIAYFLVDNFNNFAEMEYCIGSEYQCKGLATETTKAVMEYGFKQINLHKVQICHKSINIPSKCN